MHLLNEKKTRFAKIFKLRQVEPVMSNNIINLQLLVMTDYYSCIKNSTQCVSDVIVLGISGTLFVIETLLRV